MPRTPVTVKHFTNISEPAGALVREFGLLPCSH